MPVKASTWIYRGAASTLVANFALGLLGLATGVVAARLLGPSGRGELAAIQLLPALLAGVAMLGLGEAVTYAVARSKEQAAIAVTTALALSSVSALFFVVIGQWIVAEILEGYSQVVIAAAGYYLLQILLYAVIGIPHQALRGAGAFVLWNGLRLIPGMLWLAVLGWAHIAERPQASFVALAYLGGLFGLSIVVLVVARLRLSGYAKVDVSRGKQMLTFGIPIVAGSVPQILSSRLDQVMVATLLPAASLGNYAVAVGWAAIAHPLIGAIGAVMLPAMASQKDRLDQRRVFAISVRTCVLILVVAAAGLLLGTPLVLPWLFGAEFLPAVSAALILIGASSLVALNSVMVEGFRGLGTPVAGMRADIAGAVVAVSAGLLLVERYELMGAAATALLAAAASTSTLLIQARRMLHLSLMEMVLPRPMEALSRLSRGVASLRERR